MSDTAIVIYEEVKPLNNLLNPAGFLRDNDGGLWGITSRSVDVLANDDVKPFEEVQYKGKPLPVWIIDKDGEKVYSTTTYSTVRHVNKCVYTAIKNYMHAFSLGTLTSGDEDFFVDHPRVESDGVKRANVLVVSQGLVTPWGLGIDRVWVPKLSSVGEQQEEFMKALGVNPVALTDYETSNEDLIKMLELDPKSDAAKKIRNEYRFEFVERPDRPCVIMMSGYNVQQKAATVNSKWSNTSTGMGHADFIGPRDKVYKSWDIAFSLTRDPVYLNGADMARYSDLDFFADEIEAAKESEAKTKRDISTWSSLISGKSISDRDKEQNPVVTTHKPYQYKQSQFGMPKKSEAKANGANKKKYESCPTCGSEIRGASDYLYCMSCNWFEDLTDPDDLYLCPFCESEMLSNGMCPDCLFDDEIWRPSQLYNCPKHEGSNVYFSNVDHHAQRLETKDFVYACPDCIKEKETKLEDFLRGGGNHKGDLLERDKRR